MKKIIIACITVIVAFVLQTTIFQWLSFGNIVPNLLIIITALYGMNHGDRFGLVVGFFCGLLADIFFGNFIGFNALLYMYIGYFNGKFHQNFYPEDIKLPLVLFFFSDFLYSIAYYLIMFMLRGKFDFSFFLFNIIMPEVLYTTILGLVVYPIFYLLNKLISGRNKGGLNFV